MRSEEQIIEEARFCKEQLDDALERKDWYDATINQMALNIFLWILKKDKLIQNPKPRKKSLKDLIFRKKESLDDVLEAKF